MAYKELFEAEKSLALFSGWSDPDPETFVMWFNAPLEIALDVEGVVEANFTLHGECRLDLQDQNVGLELQFQLPGRRQRFSLARLDWRSIRGGHTNPRRPGKALSGRRAPATHYHDFWLNYEADKGRMAKGDLPFAREIIEVLQSFEDMRAQAGIFFNINNIELVKRPPWAYDLFHHG